MTHTLTIQNPATGESSCSCGKWSYYVRNFRPQWPMDPVAVASRVQGAYEAHVRIANTPIHTRPSDWYKAAMAEVEDKRRRRA